MNSNNNQAGIDFAQFGSESGKEPRECLDEFIVSIPNEYPLMSICTKFKTFTFFTDGKHMPVLDHMTLIRFLYWMDLHFNP